MFKLGRILCKHPPKSSDADPENKKVKICSSKSKNEKLAKHQERSTSIPVFEKMQTRKESKLQLSDKKSKESIGRKHYSKESCNSRACSKENCVTGMPEKEIDSSKLTEMINSSIKEAMQTLIKQCAMDDKKSIVLLENKYKERPKIRTTEESFQRSKDDSRCLDRPLCYPCDYPRKYEKRALGCNMKRCKGHIKDTQCPNVKETCPEKEKKGCKSPENVQTDNRRMTGNVNIYICSEASENAQRKEKQKQKSQSCTESSSETTTERTDSTCARTSSVPSDKLVSNTETRCQTLEEEKSDNCFSTGERPCAVQSDESNGSCCDRKYDDSFEMENHFEFSSCESNRTMDIDSMISSTSSTRDGCCCQDTASSYIGVHHDLSCLRPRFTICRDKFESPSTATIYQKCPAYDQLGQRSVCTKVSRLCCQDSLNRSIDQPCSYYRGVVKCCCKKRPRFRPIKRRSSFDVLHTRGSCRKWSRCSCIIEEDEIDDRCMSVPIYRSNCFDNPGNEGTLKNPENLQDCRIHEAVGDCNVRSNEDAMTNPKAERKNEDMLETKNKTSSKCLQNPFQRKSKGISKTQMKMSSSQKINQQSTPSKIASSSEKSNSSVKRVCCNVDQDLKGKRSEMSTRKGVKETFDVKGRKQRNLSEKKSKSTFLGRSIKKAMNIVKQSKVTQPNIEKDTLENNPRDDRTKPIQRDKSDTEICFQGEKENVGNPGSSRRIEQGKEEETLGASKVIGNPNKKRPKTKLQAMLAHKKTSKSINEEMSDVKKSEDKKKTERVKDTKGKSELLKRKDATGDFEEDSTNKELPCTKTTFKGESREPENLGCQADGYSHEEKCSKATINRCCYCRLPVVDCICEYRPLACHPIVMDNCKCDKPITRDELCQTGNLYRYDLLCFDCHKPRDKCCCKTTCVDHYIPTCKLACNETICVYCEYPKDKCICRAPIRKCSYCDLSFDICKCHQFEICNGRPIVTDCDGNQQICVTAWKPKSEVRRYFSRNFDAFRSDSLDECYCHKTHKAYDFNDLPYQRLSIFSDVMSELQQKISDSVCCERCKMTPCCCRASRNVEDDERKGRCYVRQRLRSPEVEYVRGKSCNSHRCGRSPDRNIQRRTMPFSRICCFCEALPCRCKKGKITIRRPRAKCYYCKSCPCTCISAREFNKSRSCKCGDSPCRAKEKETTVCGKAFNDARKKKEEKVFCSRE